MLARIKLYILANYRNNFIILEYLRLRTHLTLRQRAKYFDGYVDDFIKSNSRTDSRTLNFSYNNAISPPTYGDFFSVLMLVRFLALSGYKMSFSILDYSRRESWTPLTTEEQARFISDQMSLARYLLPADVRIEFLDAQTSVSSNLSETAENRIGDVFLASGRALYVESSYFLQCLITKYGWEIPDGFLLREPTRVQDVPCVAWHVRRGRSDQRRNSSKISIKNDFRQLRALYPNHDIKLFSDESGLEFAFSALTGSRQIKAYWDDNVRVMPQSAKGYIEAIQEVISTDFYFQRSGGGMGMVPIFSSMAYVILCEDATSFYGRSFYGRRKNFLVPWATKSQIFHYVLGDIESYPMKKFIKPD